MWGLVRVYPRFQEDHKKNNSLGQVISGARGCPQNVKWPFLRTYYASYANMLSSTVHCFMATETASNPRENNPYLPAPPPLHTYYYPYEKRISQISLLILTYLNKPTSYFKIKMKFTFTPVIILAKQKALCFNTNCVQPICVLSLVTRTSTIHYLLIYELNIHAHLLPLSNS